MGQRGSPGAPGPSARGADALFIARCNNFTKTAEFLKTRDPDALARARAEERRRSEEWQRGAEERRRHAQLFLRPLLLTRPARPLHATLNASAEAPHVQEEEEGGGL